MHINAAGDTAQMQVIDSDTGHIVSTMEYYKPDGAVMIDVADATTGVVKNEFEIKPDGFVYINGSKIITEEHRTYDFVSLAADLVVAGTAWEELLSLVTPVRLAGVYEYKFDVLFNIDTASRSAKFRYSIDNKVTWVEIEHESKDATNHEIINVFFPYPVATAKVLTIHLEVAKENAGSVLTCQYGSLAIDRKK